MLRSRRIPDFTWKEAIARGVICMKCTHAYGERPARERVVVFTGSRLTLFRIFLPVINRFASHTKALLLINIIKPQRKQDTKSIEYEARGLHPASLKVHHNGRYSFSRASTVM